MERITETLLGLRTGSAATFRNLTMTPLLAESDWKLDYLVLDEALASGAARVTEVSRQGSVPDLCFENRSNLAVLLLDGEELVGAKQNRVLNLTTLAPPSTTITIPVSCVEAGRWADLTSELRSEGRAFYAAGRARKAAHVSESLRRSGTRHSRQGEVWDDIAQKSARLDAPSPTSAMAAMYENFSDNLEEFVGAFRAAPEQAGAIFAIGDRVCGLDLFDHPDTLGKLLPKLVRSYALDALEATDQHGSGPKGLPAQDFLSEVAGARTEGFPAVGEGVDLRLSSGTVSGGALHARGRVVHLCAFPTGSASSAHGHRRSARRIARARARRRHFDSEG